MPFTEGRLVRTLSLLTCLIMCAGSSWAYGQDDGVGAGDPTDDRIQRLLDERQKREGALAQQPTTLNGGETVNPVFLDSILDYSPGIRFEERDAYFRMLELAWQTPLSKQEEFAQNFAEARRQSNPQYARRKPDQFPVVVDLYQHPEDYRGRPVSIRGTMRALTKIDPGKNNREIGEAYEGWIFTDDSQGNPVVVVFLSKPEGLKVGGDLTEEVRLTGYFMKMYGYQSQEKARKAPLIMAGAVEWRKGPEPWKAQPLGAEVYLGITMIVFLLGFVWWQGNRREMTSALHQRDVTFSQFPTIESHYEAPVGSHATEPQDS
ncbi:MAG: hypothetical protein JWP89_7045 [Schlesneria sp.]|nr:hypothetical protein [Schlesneria sp.]